MQTCDALFGLTATHSLYKFEMIGSVSLVRMHQDIIFSYYFQILCTPPDVLESCSCSSVLNQNRTIIVPRFVCFFSKFYTSYGDAAMLDEPDVGTEASLLLF